MPSAFRLSFAQPRPGPSVKFLDRLSERSESTSSTEYEKVTPPLQTIVEPDESLQPSPVVPAAISGGGAPPSSGPEVEEQPQCIGETRRMEAFNDFLKAVTVTFQHNEQDRSQKLQASLDSQKAEFASHENGRQTLFSKDLDKFERIARENQSQWDADRVFYETTRDSLMKTGRERRALLKDEAIRKLEKFAQEMCEVERKQFEKETQRMDGVVGEMVQKAKHGIETMALGTLKAKPDPIQVASMKEGASVYEYRDSVAPVTIGAPAPANQGWSDAGTSELSYFSPPPPPPPIPIPPPPPALYQQPANPSAQVTSPTRGRPLPLPPGCRSPVVMDSFTSQPQPFIAPTSFDPQTSPYALGTTITPTGATQPIIFQPSPRRLPEPQSPTESNSSKEEADRPRTLPAIPNPGLPASLPKDSAGVTARLGWENQQHAEGITSANCQLPGFEGAGEAGDEGEGKRQAFFDSALGTMQETFFLNLSGFSERFTFLEARRGGGEQSQDQEFDSLLRLLWSRFESFKAGIEKRYGVLEGLEEAFNEELKSGIVQASMKQERELNDAREKIRASFAELQLGRVEQLRVVLDELNRMKKDAKVRDSAKPALDSSTSSSHLPPSTNERKDCPRSSDPVLWPVTEEDITWGYHGCLPPTAGAGLGAGMVPPAQTGLLGAHEPPTGCLRSRTPPTGFAAQSLFKMQTFGSLPAPRPPIAELPRSASTPPIDQLPVLTSIVQKSDIAGVGEDLSKRGVNFTINESRRSVAFDKAQAERQQVFDTTERERDFEVAKEIWEHDQKFMEAELQRASEFLDKNQLRSEKLIQEQAKMRDEYYEMEGRLIRTCMMQAKASDEAIRGTAKGKIEWWEEDVKREETERRWEFEEVVKWFEESCGYST